MDLCDVWRWEPAWMCTPDRFPSCVCYWKLTIERADKPCKEYNIWIPIEKFCFVCENFAFLIEDHQNMTAAARSKFERGTIVDHCDILPSTIVHRMYCMQLVVTIEWSDKMVAARTCPGFRFSKFVHTCGVRWTLWYLPRSMNVSYCILAVGNCLSSPHTFRTLRRSSLLQTRHTGPQVYGSLGKSILRISSRCCRIYRRIFCKETKQKHTHKCRGSCAVEIIHNLHSITYCLIYSPLNISYIFFKVWLWKQGHLENKLKGNLTPYLRFWNRLFALKLTCGNFI